MNLYGDLFRKPIASIMISIFIIFCSFGATANEAIYTDVPENDAQYSAIMESTKIGVITGYEDGTFGMFREISRAEFAALICRVMKYEQTEENLIFQDVPKEHWAYQYISTLCQKGIMQGYDNNEFKPNESIVFSEALKVIIDLQGKTELAMSKGDYPVGYMILAAESGITENATSKIHTVINEQGEEQEETVSTGSTRSIQQRWAIVQMLYNAFVKNN